MVNPGVSSGAQMMSLGSGFFLSILALLPVCRLPSPHNCRRWPTVVKLPSFHLLSRDSTSLQWRKVWVLVQPPRQTYFIVVIQVGSHGQSEPVMSRRPWSIGWPAHVLCFTSRPTEEQFFPKLCSNREKFKPWLLDSSNMVRPDLWPDPLLRLYF